MLLADDVIKALPNGGINWTQGIIYAEGYGIGPTDRIAVQRKLMAERAAVVDAQRNLLEITKGVKINSVLETGTAMQESRTTISRVEGVIKGARIIKRNYQNQIASVTLMMPIAGNFLKIFVPSAQQYSLIAPIAPRYILPKTAALNPLKHTAGYILEGFINQLVPQAHASDPLIIRKDAENAAYKKLVEWISHSPDQNIDQMLQEAIQNYETNSQFSGLLIDASSVAGFELATIPKIRDQDGNILYPNARTSYDDIVNKRGVTYDFDLSDAIKNNRVATSPFIIKALSTYKNLTSDLIITTEDATRVKQSPSTLEAMQKAGVLIVVAI